MRLSGVNSQKFVGKVKKSDVESISQSHIMSIRGLRDGVWGLTTNSSWRLLAAKGMPDSLGLGF